MNKLPKFRNNLRLKSHDYAGGWYFVNLCTAGRANRFGKVVNDVVILSPEGEIVREEWLRGAELRENLTLDAFVIMPNHMHAVLSLSGEVSGSGVSTARAPERRVGHRPTPTAGGVDLGRTGTLGAVISQFKSVTTKSINRLRGTPGGAIWQRYYYDHIVRDDADLLRIRTYIQNNPLKWQLDRENQERIGEDEDDAHWFS